MKTIREWLNTLDEPYRSQALSNTERTFGRHAKMFLDECDEESLFSTLIGSFKWDQTPEGHDYWKDLYDDLNETENETR